MDFASWMCPWRPSVFASATGLVRDAVVRRLASERAGLVGRIVHWTSACTNIIINFFEFNIKNVFFIIYRCVDGTVSPCNRDGYQSSDLNAETAARRKTGEVLTTLFIILAVLIALISFFGGAIYFLK